jgi:hypothetical protein
MVGTRFPVGGLKIPVETPINDPGDASPAELPSSGTVRPALWRYCEDISGPAGFTPLTFSLYFVHLLVRHRYLDEGGKHQCRVSDN